MRNRSASSSPTLSRPALLAPHEWPPDYWPRAVVLDRRGPNGQCSITNTSQGLIDVPMLLLSTSDTAQNDSTFRHHRNSRKTIRDPTTGIEAGTRWVPRSRRSCPGSWRKRRRDHEGSRGVPGMCGEATRSEKSRCRYDTGRGEFRRPNRAGMKRPVASRLSSGRNGTW